MLSANKHSSKVERSFHTRKNAGSNPAAQSKALTLEPQ